MNKLWTLSALAGVLTAFALPCRAQIQVSGAQQDQLAAMKDRLDGIKRASAEAASTKGPTSGQSEISSLSASIYVDCAQENKIGLAKPFEDGGYFFYVISAATAFYPDLKSFPLRIDIPVQQIQSDPITGMIRMTSAKSSLILGTLKLDQQVEDYCRHNPTAARFEMRRGAIDVNPKLKFSLTLQKKYCIHEGSSVPFFDPGYYLLVIDAMGEFITDEGSISIPAGWRTSESYSSRKNCEAQIAK